MSPMLWWVIPAAATLAAYLWTRLGGRDPGGLVRKPVPGSPEDLADLARFALALREPLPSEHLPSERGVENDEAA